MDLYDLIKNHIDITRQKSLGKNLHVNIYTTICNAVKGHGREVKLLHGIL